MNTIYNAGTYSNTQSNPVKIQSNLIFNSLFNVLISQRVYSDNIRGAYSELLNENRVDGGLYGATRAYYACDILKSQDWLGDSEAANLLELRRPDAPEVQYIVQDIFKLIFVSTDEYLSKQAWSDEGTFSTFNSVILGMLAETKKVVDTTTFNQYIGCTQSPVQGAKSIDITTATAGLTGLEAKRMEALTIARDVVDLIDDMKDVTRSYNDYNFLRSYNEEDLEFIISTKYANEITKLDLPTVYHKDGVDITKMFRKLPARYFGRPVTEADKGSGKIIGANGAYDSTKGTLRAAAEFDYNNKHYFPGDALATTGTSIGTEGGLDATQVYIEDPDKIGVIMHKGSVPVFSTFQTQTVFVNPRSLTNTNYLIYGRNTLEYLKNYPFLVIKKA